MSLMAIGIAQAGMSLLGGIGRRKAAKLDAYNIESQRIQNEAIVAQRQADRQDQFQIAQSANRAMLSAMGRDITRDRSVAAFLRRNKEMAARDVSRLADQGVMEDLSLSAQAATRRAEGRDALASAAVDAFSTVWRAKYMYDDIKTKRNK